MWFVREKYRCELQPTDNHVRVWVYLEDMCVAFFKLCKRILKCVLCGIDWGVDKDYPSYEGYSKTAM